VGVTGASPWPETAFAALRVMADGDLDPGFGTGRVAVAPVPTADHAYATAVALQPDGCIVLAGSATLQPAPGTWRNDFVVLRLLAGGAADASFADDGAASADVGPYDDARSVLLQGDGKIVVVGTALAYGASFQQKSDVAVVRLLGVSSPHVLVHALQEIVRAMAAQQLLNQGQAKALIAKLQAALHQIDNGNPGPATMQLLAFRNQVLAFGQAEVLSPADTTVLQAAADGIAALLAP
jgi:uncharacterized delta-60 repeat protein